MGERGRGQGADESIIFEFSGKITRGSHAHNNNKNTLSSFLPLINPQRARNALHPDIFHSWKPVFYSMPAAREKKTAAKIGLLAAYVYPYKQYWMSFRLFPIFGYSSTLFSATENVSGAPSDWPSKADRQPAAAAAAATSAGYRQVYAQQQRCTRLLHPATAAIHRRWSHRH